jgi:hypothetical protein
VSGSMPASHGMRPRRRGVRRAWRFLGIVGSASAAANALSMAASMEPFTRPILLYWSRLRRPVP